MRYFILVSHGDFAQGLHHAVDMMLSETRTDILSIGLPKGVAIGTFRDSFAYLVSTIKAEDEILLFGDIIGGAPLATAINVLKEKGLLEKTIAIGGVNFPMVMSAALADANTPLADVAKGIIGEAIEQVREVETD